MKFDLDLKTGKTTKKGFLKSHINAKCESFSCWIKIEVTNPYHDIVTKLTTSSDDDWVVVMLL